MKQKGNAKICCWYTTLGLLFSHKSCPALFNPIDCIRLLYPWEFPGKNTGVGGHFFLQGILSYLGIEPASLMSPALAGRFFTTSATWEAQRAVSKRNNLRNIFTLWSHRGLPAMVSVIITTQRRKPETVRNRSGYAQRYRIQII